MLEKKLDKYFRKKLQSKIKNIVYFYSIDCRYEETICRDGLDLYIKNKKYNDNQYQRIMTFDDCMLIYYLSNYEELKKEILKRIDDYLKREEFTI